MATTKLFTSLNRTLTLVKSGNKNCFSIANLYKYETSLLPASQVLLDQSRHAGHSKWQNTVYKHDISLLPAQQILLNQSRFAGHSKWQNIKKTKEANDRARATRFTRLALKIRLALKSGSDNPTSNVALADAIEQAMAASMPKTTIKNVIEKSKRTTENGKQHIIEYRGAGNVCLLVEVFTDNLRRPRHYVNGVCKKAGFVESRAAALHQFEERGIILASNTVGGNKVSLSEAEEHAIEADAEEVSENDDEHFQFLTSISTLNTVRKSLLELGYSIVESGLGYVPKAPLTLDDESLEALATLIEKIEDIDEVMKVYPNV